MDFQRGGNYTGQKLLEALRSYEQAITTQNLEVFHQVTAVLHSEDPEYTLTPDQLEQFQLPEDTSSFV